MCCTHPKYGERDKRRKSHAHIHTSYSMQHVSKLKISHGGACVHSVHHTPRSEQTVGSLVPNLTHLRVFPLRNCVVLASSRPDIHM